MKIIILLLVIVLLMGCTSLRYGDDLRKPYTEQEIKGLEMDANLIKAFSIITAGFIIYAESNKTIK